MAPTAAFLLLLALTSDPFWFHQNDIMIMGSERTAIDLSMANLGDCGVSSFFVRW